MFPDFTARFLSGATPASSPTLGELCTHQQSVLLLKLNRLTGYDHDDYQKPIYQTLNLASLNLYSNTPQATLKKLFQNNGLVVFPRRIHVQKILDQDFISMDVAAQKLMKRLLSQTQKNLVLQSADCDLEKNQTKIVYELAFQPLTAGTHHSKNLTVQFLLNHDTEITTLQVQLKQFFDKGISSSINFTSRSSQMFELSELSRFFDETAIHQTKTLGGNIGLLFKPRAELFGPMNFSYSLHAQSREPMLLHRVSNSKTKSVFQVTGFSDLTVNCELTIF